jgi:TonB family protein
VTDVTDVIVARQQRSDPLGSVLAWSIAAHVGIVALLVFGPFDWGVGASEPPVTVMTISLAGAPGPRAGGMTPMGGREIPEAAPKPVPPVPAPAPPKPAAREAPPAPKPRPTTPAARTTRPAAKPAAEEPTPGATRTETGARGQGFGLSTGGSGGSGVQLEVGDFCCPDYLQQMVSLIQQNWQSKQGVAGATIMRFTITRRGSIEGVQVFQTSGFVALDLAAQQALLRTRLPELPPQYPNQTLTMRVTFDYSR